MSGSRPATTSGLSDEGVNAGFADTAVLVAPVLENAEHAFVKFFGKSDYRASPGDPVFEEVKRTGCHWACTYPKNKRPRQVEDGAVMFMARLVANPNDMIIYGRAVGLRHVEGRDEASAEEIKQISFKKDWPIYVRVRHAQFVAGTLENGIRLSELMDTLKADSFISTQTNARDGSGNTDPRTACRQKAAMPLTKQSFAWLNQRLAQAFAKHGTLTPAELETLDWPAASTIGL